MNKANRFRCFLRPVIRSRRSSVPNLVRGLRNLGVVIFLLLPGMLNAQATSHLSCLSGTLTDTQGLLVPDATITLLRRATSRRREARTDRSGGFSFAGLEAG